MSKKKIICTVAILGLIAGSIGVYNLGTKEDTNTGSMKPAIEKINIAAVDIQDKKIAEAEFIKAVEGLTEEEIISLKEELKGAINKQARDAIVAKAADIKTTKANVPASNTANNNNVSSNKTVTQSGVVVPIACTTDGKKCWDTTDVKETGRGELNNGNIGIDYETVEGSWLD